MKKLLALNLIGLAVTLALAALLWNTASSARTATEHAAELDAIAREATQIRVNMVEMSDAMRGFLLDTTQQQEWQNKLKADEHLVEAVEQLSKVATDAFYLDLAKRIGDLDETRLNPTENKVMELSKTDRAAAAAPYFSEYVPIRLEQMKMVNELSARATKAAEDDAAQYLASLSTLRTIVLAVVLGVLVVMGGSTVMAARTTFRLTARIGQTASDLGEGIDRSASMAGQMADIAQQSHGISQTAQAIQQMEQVTQRTAASAEEAAAAGEQLARDVETSRDGVRELEQLVGQNDGRNVRPGRKTAPGPVAVRRAA